MGLRVSGRVREHDWVQGAGGDGVACGVEGSASLDGAR